MSQEIQTSVIDVAERSCLDCQPLLSIITSQCAKRASTSADAGLQLTQYGQVAHSHTRRQQQLPTHGLTAAAAAAGRLTVGGATALPGIHPTRLPPRARPLHLPKPLLQRHPSPATTQTTQAPSRSLLPLPPQAGKQVAGPVPQLPACGCPVDNGSNEGRLGL